MTGPPTEAGSILLGLKDDAKQGRVSGIASPGWRSFCVPPIQHIEAMLAGSRASLAVTLHSVACLKNSSGGCIGFELLELRTPPTPVVGTLLGNL
jgi:hypothetical protein